MATNKRKVDYDRKGAIKEYKTKNECGDLNSELLNEFGVVLKGNNSWKCFAEATCRKEIHINSVHRHLKSLHSIPEQKKQKNSRVYRLHQKFRKVTVQKVELQLYQFHAIDSDEPLSHFGVLHSDLEQHDIPIEIPLYSFTYGRNKRDNFIAFDDIIKVLSHSAIEWMANAPILVVLDLDETMASLLRKRYMSKSMINDMGGGSLLDFGKQKFDLDIITTCYNNEEMHYAIRPNVDLFVKFLKAHEHIIDVVVFSAAVQEICDDLVNMIELPVKACYGRRNSKSPVIPKDISHLPGASSYDYIVVFDDQPQNFP